MIIAINKSNYFFTLPLLNFLWPVIDKTLLWLEWGLYRMSMFSLSFIFKFLVSVLRLRLCIVDVIPSITRSLPMTHIQKRILTKTLIAVTQVHHAIQPSSTSGWTDVFWQEPVGIEWLPKWPLSKMTVNLAPKWLVYQNDRYFSFFQQRSFWTY